MSEITTITTAPQSAAPALSELEQMTNAYAQATALVTSLQRSRDGFKALLADTEKTLEATRKELYDLRVQPNPMIAKLEEEVQALIAERDAAKQSDQKTFAVAETMSAELLKVKSENTRLLSRITELERPAVVVPGAAAPAKRGPGRPPRTHVPTDQETTDAVNSR